MSRMAHIAPESWPGLAEHMRSTFLAEQAAERERLRCERSIEERQSPENRGTTGQFSHFNRYGWRKIG